MTAAGTGRVKACGTSNRQGSASAKTLELPDVSRRKECGRGPGHVFASSAPSTPADSAEEGGARLGFGRDELPELHVGAPQPKAVSWRAPPLSAFSSHLWKSRRRSRAKGASSTGSPRERPCNACNASKKETAAEQQSCERLCAAAAGQAARPPGAPRFGRPPRRSTAWPARLGGHARRLPD